MDPDFHLKKCRDCDNRVQDVDPNNLAFKGLSHCRAQPPGLIFVAGLTPQGPAAQPMGSNYSIVTDDLGACRLFEPHGGKVRRNIVNTISPFSGKPITQS